MERLLAGVEPFKRLTPAERDRLVAAAREKHLAKGDTLFQAGEPSDAVWVVKTGRVHLMKFLPDGKASTTCVMTPGEPFCCLPALDQKAYPADAIAAVESVVIRIPQHAFHDAMQRSAVFMQGALCLFCDRLRGVEEKSCMVYESAAQRLAQVLLGLTKQFGATVPLTRQELAEIAGLTLETTIRTLSRFKAQRLIRSVRGTTTILDASRLTRLAQPS